MKPYLWTVRLFRTENWQNHQRSNAWNKVHCREACSRTGIPLFVGMKRSSGIHVISCENTYNNQGPSSSSLLSGSISSLSSAKDGDVESDSESVSDSNLEVNEVIFLEANHVSLLPDKIGTAEIIQSLSQTLILRTHT